MKIKFLVTMFLIFLLAGSTMVPSFAAVEKDTVILLNIGKPTMVVNGVDKKIDLDIKVTPVLVQNTTLVPIRTIIESLGGEVKWDGKERKVSISYNSKTVQLWLNKNEALVNGTKVNSKVAPKSIAGRTMVPLRFVSESLGLCVNWEGKTKAISVSTTNDYVAIMGGQKLLKSEYNMFLNRTKNEIINSLSQNSSIEIPEGNIWDAQIDGTKAGDLAKQMALDYSRELKLLLAKANENKIILSKEDIETIDTSIDKMVLQEGSKELAEKKLMEYYNVNLSQYTAFLKDYELVNKYLDSELKKFVISDDDIKKIYENNKSSYEEVTVKHILLLTSSQGMALSAEEKEVVKKKADEILLKVSAGEDFAALVKQYSEDTESIDVGGEYTFGKGKMVKEFEDWSFQAEEGEVGIVETSYGYHIMEFVGKSTFEDAKASIRDSLTKELMNSYIAKLLSDTNFVVIKNHSVYDAIEMK